MVEGKTAAVDPKLLEILVCPVTHTRLVYDAAAQELVSTAAGLAYPRSGEGIRPAIESALIAARIIRDAAGVYSRDKLAPYAERLSQRFGRRIPDRETAPWLPKGLRRSLAAKLLATAWFGRNVVIDRWFLHSAQRAMVPG